MYSNQSRKTSVAGATSNPVTIVKVPSTSFDWKELIYRWRWPLSGLIFVGVLLMLILIPLSFSYVEAGEIGLRRKVIGKKVDIDSDVYEMGRYHLGPEHEFQIFNARVQQKSFVLDVVASNSRGFALSVVCFYRIKKNEVKQLFAKFTTSWDTPAQNEVISSIKGITNQFDIPDYITNIFAIEQLIATEVTSALAVNNLETVDDKCLILRANFNGDIDNQYLQSVVQIQTNERQIIAQQVAIITQDTETQRQAILANKTLVEATGQANATRIVETARAEANRIRELARTDGFTLLFDYFNVTNSTTKTAFLEWYALKNNLNHLTLLDGISNVLVQLS